MSLCWLANAVKSAACGVGFERLDIVGKFVGGVVWLHGMTGDYRSGGSGQIGCSRELIGCRHASGMQFYSVLFMRAGEFG